MMHKNNVIFIKSDLKIMHIINMISIILIEFNVFYNHLITIQGYLVFLLELRSIQAFGKNVESFFATYNFKEKSYY